MDSALDVAVSYGLPGLIVLLVIVIAAWALAHGFSEPGSTVSILFGLASYKKKYPSPKPSRFKPIDVVHNDTGLLWRLIKPPKNWVEDDLTKYAGAHKGSFIAGPHHEMTATSW